MFKRSFRYFFIPCLVLLAIVTYQNCGGEFTVLDEVGSFSSREPTLADLDLGDHHPGIRLAKTDVKVQPLYANRLLVYNIFMDIFGPSIRLQLADRIAWASQDMGMDFNLYSQVDTISSCDSSRHPLIVCDPRALELTAPPVSGISALREGRRTRACHIAAESPQALSYAFNRIQQGSSLTLPPMATVTNYRRAFQLFFRGRPSPGPEVFDNMQIILDEAASPAEGWADVLLGLCLSPHWQVL